MNPRREDLEVRIRWISFAVIVLFSLAFALGLILYAMQPDGRAAVTALHAGLVMLIASPAARMVLATVERIRSRDWPFVMLMTVIALELAVVLWRAAAGS